MDPLDLLASMGVRKKETPTPKKAVPISKLSKSRVRRESLIRTDEDRTPPTALVIDKWGMRIGEELADKLARPGLPTATAYEMSDFHSVCFDSDPVLNDYCLAPRRQEFIEALMESSEYKSLHTTTMFDRTASELSAIKLMESYRELRKKDKKREESGAEDERGADTALFIAVAGAVSEATEELEELNLMGGALGLGAGGEPRKELDAKSLMELFELVKNDPQLREICESAGRLRLSARSQQRIKTVHGYDEMIGVELSGDVWRLLPSELSMLTDPILELDMMRRLVERACMSREFRGVDKVGKGPIIAVVDESGSMQGRKVNNAKALALTMAWIARQQNRWCCLIGYSGGEKGNLLTLQPNKWDTTALVAWLKHFYSKGSDLDIPLREMPKFWDMVSPPEGKTDIIFQTDAAAYFNARIEADFNAWRRSKQARVISLVIGNLSSGRLGSVSDEVHIIGDFSASESGVESCLSI